MSLLDFGGMMMAWICGVLDELDDRVGVLGVRGFG